MVKIYSFFFFTLYLLNWHSNENIRSIHNNNSFHLQNKEIQFQYFRSRLALSKNTFIANLWFLLLYNTCYIRNTEASHSQKTEEYVLVLCLAPLGFFSYTPVIQRLAYRRSMVSLKYKLRIKKNLPKKRSPVSASDASLVFCFIVT